MSGLNGDGSCGRFGALRWAVTQRTGDAIATLTLIMMAVVGNRSWLCYLSVAKLAKMVGCDARTVQRKLRYLEVRRYIACVPNGHRSTWAYRLRPDPDSE